MPTGQKRALDLITDGCEPSCGYWELNSGPLKEQAMILTIGAISPAPQQWFLNINFGASEMAQWVRCLPLGLTTEFGLWEPHDGRREPTFADFPQTSYTK